MTAWLRRLDIDSRAFHALLRAYLLMDFRSQHFGRATGAHHSELMTPLFWVVGQYLLVGGTLSVVLFARVDAYFFSMAALGVSMLVIGSSVIVEFNEVVLDSRDLEIIGHRPVQARTYAAARLVNLLGYALVMTVALNVFPAIVGLGLRDTSWAFLPAYSTAALLGNLFVVAALIVIYAAVVKGAPGDSARDTLAWLQIVLIMVFFYGGQAVFRDPASRLEMVAYHPPEWTLWTPPAWLASFVDSFAMRPAPRWWILAAAVPAVAGMWLAAWRSLSSVYAEMQPGGGGWKRSTLPALVQPGALGGSLTRLVTRAGEERAAFWLCSTMLRRDSDLRMRSWPPFGALSALLLLGMLTSQLGDPIAGSCTAGILSIACLLLPAMLLPTLMHNLRFSRDHDARWMLAAAPVRDPSALVEGLRKALMWRLLAPVFAALLLIFAVVWKSLPHAALHVALGWLLAGAAGHASKMGVMRGLPFAEPLARGETMGAIGMFSAIVSGGLMIAGVAYHAAAGSALRIGALALAVVVAALLLRGAASAAVNRNFAREAAA